MPYIITGMKPFKTLFFLSMVIMFYIFAPFKHQIRITKYTDFVEAIIESGGEGGGGEGGKIMQVETNCSPGIREDKLPPDRMN